MKEPPIIVNDLVNSTEEEKDKIRDLVITKYSSDMLSILPACQCGNIKGEYAIGTKCELCNSIVKSVVEEDVEPLLWCRKPAGASKLINPMVWIMLKNRFKKSGFNIIQWLCDTSYRTEVKQPLVVNRIIETGIQRGYNNFVHNFDTIMPILFTMKDFALKRGQVDYLYDLLQINRDSIFCDFLPLPNKALLVIEKTNVGVYIDPIIVGAIDAIEILTSIDSPFSEHSVRVKENRTIKALVKLSEFYEGYIRTGLASRAGQFRRHLYGSRTNFSFRAVITSLTDAHSYEELHAPWGIGVTAFRPHLINKLCNRGYDLNNAIGFLMGHVEAYNELLDVLLCELIAESPGKKLSCVMQRN